MRAARGDLRSGGAGVEVHAGSFLRKREVVLDASLLAHPREFTRIVLHELFHFVWLRAGNGLRRSFERLLELELARGARGELGWSAEHRKVRLAPRDVKSRSRRWREYACESFCDTAAWQYGGLARHDEFTLAARFRAARRAWFLSALARPEISI